MPTFQDVISGFGGVRSVINDTDPTKYRYTDADLMGYANDCLVEIAIRRPDLFSTVDEITCVEGSIQRVTAARALALLDIYNVKNGRVVTEVTRYNLDRYDENWRSAAPAAAKHWMRNTGSALGFFVYPPATAGQVLIGEWSTAPAAYTIQDQVPIPYTTSIKDYIVFRAEARDDEHVTSGRALAFYKAFERGLGLEVQAKEAASGDG